MSDSIARTDSAFDFSGMSTREPIDDDGTPEPIWIDLGFPTDGSTADSTPDPLPVLMVLADQQDFYFNE